MVTADLKWFEAADGLRLRTRTWEAAGDPAVSVALLHGGVEHSGRYQHTAERLVAAGFEVHALDQRSHGGSDRVRGVPLQIDRFDDLLDDTEAWLRSLRRSGGGRPLFVVAHSMGALISLTLAARDRLPVDGLVTTGAALTVIAPAAFARAAEIAAVDPDAIVLQLPRGGLDGSTRDEAMKAAVAADETHADVTGVPARFMVEVARITAEVAGELANVSVPLLVLHGTADRMADPARSVALVEQAASPDKTLHLVEGGWHALLRDIDRHEVEDLIVAWINARS